MTNTLDVLDSFCRSFRSSEPATTIWVPTDRCRQTTKSIETGRALYGSHQSLSPKNDETGSGIQKRSGPDSSTANDSHTAKGRQTLQSL